MTLLTKSVFISQVLLFHQTLGRGSFDYSGDRIRGGNKCWLIKGRWVVHHVWSLTALQPRSWTFSGKTVIYTVIYRQGHILDSLLNLPCPLEKLNISVITKLGFSELTGPV